jgi:hypothetical protein
MQEASITINERVLTNAQAMAVRVAISNFYSDMMEPDALGDDEHGRAMVTAYRERLVEVIRLLA